VSVSLLTVISFIFYRNRHSLAFTSPFFMPLHIGERHLRRYRYFLTIDSYPPFPLSFLPFFHSPSRSFFSRRSSSSVPCPFRSPSFVSFPIASPRLDLGVTARAGIRAARCALLRGIPHSWQSKPRSSTLRDRLVFRSCRARGSRGEARRDASIILSRSSLKFAKWDAKRAYLQGIRSTSRRDRGAVECCVGYREFH